MKKADLILVGGFLGAGKTTLLKAASQVLAADGKNVGVITNDQTSSLVDTAILKKSAKFTEEVSGSCFCCNFNGFIDAVESLIAKNMNIILGEPVGSCTDLSATILQPVKDLRDHIRLLPLSVVADPTRLDNTLKGDNGGLHPDAAYIVERQFAEADIILINKSDTLDTAQLRELIEKTKERYPDKEVMAISAKKGQGIASWLGMLGAVPQRGATIVEVDYDRYASGEAVLGSVNMEIDLKKQTYDWNKFCQDFMEQLAKNLAADKMAVAHAKIMLDCDCCQMTANLVDDSGKPAYTGKVCIANQAHMILNCRAEGEPDAVLATIEKTLAEVCDKGGIAYTQTAVKSLKPGRPNPTHRYGKVIDVETDPCAVISLRPIRD